MNNKINKERPNILIIIIILIIVLIIGIILNLKNYNINIFNAILDSVFNYIETNISNTKTITGNLSYTSTNSNIQDNNWFTILNKLYFTTDYKIDLENKIIDLNLYSKYNEDRLLNGNLYIKNNKAYIYLENLYNNYIEIPLDDYSNIFMNKEDYLLITKKLIISTKNCIKKEYFTKETTTLNNSKVKKTTLILNRNNLEEIITNIINELEKDEEFLTSISNILDITKEETKIYLNSYRKIKNNYKDSYISVYTKGTKILRIELYNNSDKLLIDIYDDDYRLLLYKNDIVTYELDIILLHNTYYITIEDENTSSITTFTMENTTEFNTKIEDKEIEDSISYKDKRVNTIYFKILTEKGILNFIRDLSKTGI